MHRKTNFSKSLDHKADWFRENLWSYFVLLLGAQFFTVMELWEELIVLTAITVGKSCQSECEALDWLWIYSKTKNTQLWSAQQWNEKLCTFDEINQSGILINESMHLNLGAACILFVEIAQWIRAGSRLQTLPLLMKLLQIEYVVLNKRFYTTRKWSEKDISLLSTTKLHIILYSRTQTCQKKIWKHVSLISINNFK